MLDPNTPVPPTQDNIDHIGVSTALALVIGRRLTEMMPQIQHQIMRADVALGLTFRVEFRRGREGEASQIVAAVEMSAPEPGVEVPISLSATGDFSHPMPQQMAPPPPPVMQPQPQLIPQPLAPMPPPPPVAPAAVQPLAQPVAPTVIYPQPAPAQLVPQPATTANPIPSGFELGPDGELRAIRIARPSLGGHDTGITRTDNPQG